MAANHGTRTRYNTGCRCADCVESNRAYGRARARQLKTARASVRALPITSPDAPPESRQAGAVEEAVLAEIGGLSTAAARPGLVAVALAHARVLDDPRAVNQHSPNGKALADVLRELRKGSEQGAGRLASVRRVSKPA